MYTVDEHEISCVITDTIAQINDVVWETTTSYTFTLDKKAGVRTDKGTQTSTLKLTAANLEELKKSGGSDPSHTFTCKTTLEGKVFSATQTISIHTPGNHYYFFWINS